MRMVKQRQRPKRKRRRKQTIHNVKLYDDDNDDDDDKHSNNNSYSWQRKPQNARSTCIHARYNAWIGFWGPLWLRCTNVFVCVHISSFSISASFSKWRKIYWCNFKLIVCSCIHLFIFIYTLPVYCINIFHFFSFRCCCFYLFCWKCCLTCFLPGDSVFFLHGFLVPDTNSPPYGIKRVNWHSWQWFFRKIGCTEFSFASFALVDFCIR